MQVFLLIVSLLALVAVLIFAARQGIRLYREAREQEARDREERRESIALSRRMWRTIRQGEEMGIDVTDLRQARNTLDFTRKADAFLNHKRTNAILPLAFAIIPVLFYALVPFQMIVGWFGWSLLGVILLLCLWSGLLLFRYSRLKRTIVRLITEQEAILLPSPFQ
jgi:Flp pilus assembly protein TadB